MAIEPTNPVGEGAPSDVVCPRCRQGFDQHACRYTFDKTMETLNRVEKERAALEVKVFTLSKQNERLWNAGQRVCNTRPGAIEELSRVLHECREA